MSIPPYFSIFYRLRFDRRSLAVRRQEVYLAADTKLLNLTLGYLDLTQVDPATEFQNRREVQADGSLNFTRHWSIVGNIIQNVSSNPYTVKYGIGLQYEDECFKIRTQVRRNFTRDRDIQPSTTVSINVVLSHLGS